MNHLIRGLVPRSLALRSLALIVLLSTSLAACDLLKVEKINDPNNPSSGEFLDGATQAQLQNLVTGLEARHRNYAETFDILGTFGREALAYYASDPRFATVWLGQAPPAGAEESPDFFGGGSLYQGPYQAIKQANFLAEALKNTDVVSQTEANGYLGFAKTIEGIQYLTPLNTQYQNGIRVAVEDPLNPGPFLGYEEALGEVRATLDEGASDLRGAGSSFAFTLSPGYEGFDTPETMLQVNRAIEARAAIYAEDWQGALDALSNSFLELERGAESMWRGPALSYGAPPDEFNPLYYPRNVETNQILMVHPDVIEDTLAGDERVDRKFFRRNEPISNADIPVNAFYQDDRWASNSDEIPFIRNEELILIYAEAHAQLGNAAESVEAINIIRNTWGLSDYTGPTDTTSLIDEILFQRRYSLWLEGHRWIDARRYGRLDELPTNLGGRIFTQLARPLSEINWEESSN